MGRFDNMDTEQGFTLIELLIAIFIFTIVISAVYGAYRVTFKVIYGSESHLTISRNGRVAMERITDDLKSVVAGPGGEFRGERHDLLGTRGDSLTFISSSHLVLSNKDLRTGYAAIAYSVERNEKNGLLNLYRSDWLLVPGAQQEKNESDRDILSEGLKEVSFSYLDADGKETDGWLSDEDQQISEKEGQLPEPLLPALVFVKLVFAEAIDSKDGTVFKTAVPLPKRVKEKK